MIQTLRRLFNRVDALFDRRAIHHAIHLTRDGGEAGRRLTARQAFALLLPVAHQLDAQARLKSIVSPHGADADGTSAIWDFAFDLPRRRAQLFCEWSLAWDTAADAWGPARLEFSARPFPAEDGPVRKLVAQGHLLHRQLYGLWQQERRRRPDLPHQFRDTPAVMAELISQGLDLSRDEFSLATGLSPAGHPAWIAQARRKSWFCAFG